MQSKSESNELDYVFLLLVHVVCADEQVHIEESRRLNDLGVEMRLSADTQQEVEKILNQAEDRLGVEVVARRVPVNKRQEALDMLLVMTYVDGFCDPLERVFLEDVLRVWGMNPDELDRRCAQAESLSTSSGSDAGGNPQDDLSFGARILKSVDSIVPQSLLENLQKLVPPRARQRIDELRQEILLAGPDYDTAIAKCEKVANQDIKVTEEVLEATQNTLHGLMKSFQGALDKLGKKAAQGTAQSVQDVIKQLRTDCEELDRHIFHHIEKVRASLQRKKRATRFFTVSFLGKTKVGKSTLHAIVTGDGWEAIGVGAQRTTRLNRVYQWKNIRVIDTPGIGAPGGKSDEEIAKSVVDESDVICFVVTNNNQQESEFQFLRLLKERAKPLVILLNVQDNLLNAGRFERFLSEPDTPFSDEKRHLGGHMDRIRKYAKDSYGNDYFDIVPAQLLAAQLARNGTHQEQAQKLYRCSRVQQFLDTLRMALIDHGVIRRSQTLLGCTVADIIAPLEWVQTTSRRYVELAQALRLRQRTALKQIDAAGKDALGKLHVSLQAVFNDLKGSTAGFAEDHWDSEESTLNRAWGEHLKRKRANARMESALTSANEHYEKEVRDVLDELGRDMSLISDLHMASGTLSEQDTSTFWKSFFKWGGSLSGVAGAAVVLGLYFGVMTANFWNPVGWVLGVGAVLGGLFSSFFTSKATKRRNAVERITTALSESIERQRDKVTREAERDFKKRIDMVSSGVATYFDVLVKALQLIGTTLGKAQGELEQNVQLINHAYATRVLEWVGSSSDGGEPHDEMPDILAVDRALGKHMTIRTRKPVTLRKDTETITHVLQEEVYFQTEDGVVKTTPEEGMSNA
jgi:GTP-binding protein EngB required for normal cell division/uncharacterized tellurite resistance protein B-like protein